jgi:hypothetical protein
VIQTEQQEFCDDLGHSMGIPTEDDMLHFSRKGEVTRAAPKTHLWSMTMPSLPDLLLLRLVIYVGVVSPRFPAYPVYLSFE